MLKLTSQPTCDLSIIIVSYRVPDLLDDCLASVYKQTEGIDFEVLVVDNSGLVRCLDAAGIDFGILGTEEGCCGDATRRAGNEFVFAELAAHLLAHQLGDGPPRPQQAQRGVVRVGWDRLDPRSAK